MIGTYIWRNLRHRKVRTVLMILSLLVGVGALAALNATVDSYRRYFAGTVAGEVGAFDLVVAREDTEPNPFLDGARLAPLLRAVPGVDAVAERVHSVAAMRAGDKSGDLLLVALDPATDKFGALELTAGELDLAEGPEGVPGAVVLQETADTFGLEVGVAIELQYAAPVTRLAGQAPDESASRRRTTASWVVRGIATQRGVTGQSGNEGVIVGLAAARERFNLGQSAERLLLGYDPELYQSADPQRAAFQARQVSVAVRDALEAADTGYRYIMPRPRAVIDGADAFIFFQALITMYGLLSLGVVGLLIRTLIMTNVQEQTRDMAVLRILGAPRRHLFNLVAIEVAVVGAIGVGLGVLAGQAVNNLVIVPLIAERAAGLGANTPLVSLSAALIAVLTASVVLAVSALAPARKAAGTKVTNAINPGIAEGLGLDELAKLREVHTDVRIPSIGLVVLFFPALIFFAFPLAFDFGVLWMMAALIFGALFAMIVGAAMVFYLVILPMERGLLLVIDGLASRVGYFVRRTVLRGKERNTLIALMIVMSATLPTFLSTSLALEVANTATDRRLNGGAPFRINPPRRLESGRRVRATPLEEQGFELELLAELRAETGFGAAVGRSVSFPTTARDGLGLRDVRVQAVGVDGDLAPVLYSEAVEFTQGDSSALARIVEEPGTAVIGAGLATYFDRSVGDTLVLEGVGRDHMETVTIVGVAKRLGGVGTFTAKQTQVWGGGSTVLVGMDSYRELVNNPLLGPPDRNARLVQTILATSAPGVDESELTSDLRLRYATEHHLSINSTAETIESAQEEAHTGQLFLIVLTAITSVLAVFGVFAVIYVSVYGRRGEIGMMKAMGDSGRHLLAVFVGEALVMTLSATLTGVTAGVVLAYSLRLSEGFRMELPTIFAIDTVVVSAMLILMILASLVGAVIATHSFRRMRAVEISRTL